MTIKEREAVRRSFFSLAAVTCRQAEAPVTAALSGSEVQQTSRLFTKNTVPAAGQGVCVCVCCLCERVCVSVRFFLFGVFCKLHTLSLVVFGPVLAVGRIGVHLGRHERRERCSTQKEREKKQKSR